MNIESRVTSLAAAAARMYERDFLGGWGLGGMYF
jgi:hypothetical protein